MFDEMKSRTVLITGASGGIGTAAAEAFAEKGYNLILQYNSRSAEELAEKLKGRGVSACAIKADLSRQPDIEKLAEEAKDVYCGIDVLVNCAGTALYEMFTDTDREKWNRVLDVNLTSAAMLTREIVPAMIKRQSGCVINVSSIWGETGGSMEVAYSASKAGLIGFTRALAKELAPSGIRVNAVSPGPVDTAMMDMFPEDEKKEIADSIPMGRFAAPDEIAKSIVFLAEADYITGYVLGINGGAQV